MNEGYDIFYTTTVSREVLSASRLLLSYRILHSFWNYVISIGKIICGIPTLCENIAVITSLFLILFCESDKNDVVFNITGSKE
jgi:hypothetical protein